MRRRFWTGTVGDIVRRVHEDKGLPVFVKPAGQLKRFTGGIVASWSDLHVLGGAPDATPVHCVEVVNWVSEYRVYVLHGKIVGIRHYTGDSRVALDEQVVHEAIECLEASGDSIAGYGIDFGILGSGETALVEVNEGYGLGSYGLEDDVYTELLIARWAQLAAGA